MANLDPLCSMLMSQSHISSDTRGINSCESVEHNRTHFMCVRFEQICLSVIKKLVICMNKLSVG